MGLILCFVIYYSVTDAFLNSVRPSFSQEALAQICEYSEAGITVRGTYFPPKKEPQGEDRKLYLAIEATSELAIQRAKKEITRLIKEELIRLVRNGQIQYLAEF